MFFIFSKDSLAPLEKLTLPVRELPSKINFFLTFDNDFF